MLGCSSLLPTEIAFLIHYSSFKSLLATCYPLDLTSLYSFCLSFFFTSLMKESMITDRPLVLTPPALCFLRLRSRATLFFFSYSRSYFSHPNFTSCKLQKTHKVPTDTDHWQVRCSPIDSGITHNVKQTRVGSRVLGSRVLCEDL